MDSPPHPIADDILTAASVQMAAHSSEFLAKRQSYAREISQRFLSQTRPSDIITSDLQAILLNSFDCALNYLHIKQELQNIGVGTHTINLTAASYLVPCLEAIENHQQVIDFTETYSLPLKELSTQLLGSAISSALSAFKTVYTLPPGRYITPDIEEYITVETVRNHPELNLQTLVEHLRNSPRRSA